MTDRPSINQPTNRPTDGQTGSLGSLASNSSNEISFLSIYFTFIFFLKLNGLLLFRHKVTTTEDFVLSSPSLLGVFVYFTLILSRPIINLFMISLIFFVLTQKLLTCNYQRNSSCTCSNANMLNGLIKLQGVALSLLDRQNIYIYRRTLSHLVETQRKNTNALLVCMAIA